MVIDEIETLKQELDFWKEMSKKGYLIRQKGDGSWYIEADGVTLPVAYPSQDDAVEVTKKIIKTKSQNMFKATVLYNEGYGKQCREIPPFEADSKEIAQGIANGIVESLFGEDPKTDIIEVRVAKVRR